MQKYTVSFPGSPHFIRNLAGTSGGRKFRPKWPEFPVFTSFVHNWQISLALFKGVFFPNVPQPFELVFAPIVDLLWACYLPLPPMNLASIWEKDRGDLDLHLHQSNPSLCEGNPLDLDLGEIWCSSSYLFFPLIPPIAFVALLEFEREVLEHLCGVLSIAFGSSVWLLHGDTWRWKFVRYSLRELVPGACSSWIFGP